MRLLLSHTRLVSGIIIFLMLMAGHFNVVAKEKTPDQIPGTTKVFAEDVIDLAEKLPELLIIDARITQDRKQGYIEGSVSLPDIKTDCKSLARVIPAKSAPVLFYCNGVKCGRSVKSSRRAVKCGYTNIYWFRGGFEEWKNKAFPIVKQ